MSDYYSTLTLPEVELHPYCFGHTPDKYLRSLYAIVRKEKPRLVVELGTYLGYSANSIGEALLANAAEGSPGRLVTIDWQHDVVYTPDAHLAPVVEVICGDTHDAALRDTVLAGRGPIDLLFVDAAHEYENCRPDYDTWKSQVKPGGMICFHDIRDIEGTRRLWAEVQAEYPAGITSMMDGNEMGVLVLPAE